MEDKKLSEIISSFLNMLQNSKTSCEYAKEELKKTDDATQDLLHILELEETKYKDRAKIATQLSKIRQNRRGYKDMYEELEPIVCFLENNRAFIGKLKDLLGEVRRQEKYHSKRRYFPRIISKETIDK